MEISTGYLNNGVQNNGLEQGQEIGKGSNAVETPRLQEGAVVNAEIVDLGKNTVTVQLADGRQVQGLLFNGENALIGAVKQFAVQYVDGKLVLSMEQTSHTDAAQARLLELLQSYGIKPENEKLLLANVLLQAQLPLTKENILKLNQALKLFGPEGMERGIFLLKNNIPISQAAGNAMESINIGQSHLLNQISGFTEDLQQLPREWQNNVLARLLPPENLISDGDMARVLQTFMKEAESGPAQAAQNLEGTLRQLPPDHKGLQMLEATLVQAYPEGTDMVRQAFTGSLEKAGFIENYTGVMAGIAGKMETVQMDSVLARTFEQLEIAPLQFTEQEKMALADRISFILGDKREPGWKQEFINQMGFPLEWLEKEALEGYVNRLAERVSETYRLLQKGEVPNGEKVLNRLGEMKDSFQMMAQVRTELALPLPLVIQDKARESSLYIFRDKKKTGKGGQSQSALVALDTVCLGRYEVYLVKNGSQVSCQFRLENEEVKELTLSQLQTLKNMLKSKHYDLTQYAFHMAGEAFTLGAKEPEIETVAVTEQDMGKISFDIRT